LCDDDDDSERLLDREGRYDSVDLRTAHDGDAAREDKEIFIGLSEILPGPIP
jgi:hypothetical protein